jgi:hypothetical protein
MIKDTLFSGGQFLDFSVVSTLENLTDKVAFHTRWYFYNTSPVSVFEPTFFSLMGS